MLLPRRAASAVMAIFMCIFVVTLTITLMKSKLNPVYWLALTSRPEHVIQTPLTTHIVLFQFKPGTSQTAIKQVTTHMLSLKKSCIHPNSGSSYIRSITGGKDTSIEDRQNGISHAFILQFDSEDDRNYYVDHDPSHKAFKDAAAAVVEKAQVVDFQDGVFI